MIIKEISRDVANSCSKNIYCPLPNNCVTTKQRFIDKLTFLKLARYTSHYFKLPITDVPCCTSTVISNTTVYKVSMLQYCCIATYFATWLSFSTLHVTLFLYRPPSIKTTNTFD